MWTLFSKRCCLLSIAWGALRHMFCVRQVSKYAVQVEKTTRLTRRFFRVAALALIPLAFVRGDIATDGKILTVTTANAVAIFRNGDVVALTNPVTGEHYLQDVGDSSLLGMDLIQPTGQELAGSGWTVSAQQVASISFSDSVRSVSLRVSIDPGSQEIVISVSGQAQQSGVRSLAWGVAGLPLKKGRLVLPAVEGSYLDASNFPGDLLLDYPTHWQSQMLVFEGAQGGFQIYSTDRSALFKKLHVAAGSGSSTVTASFVTDAVAPFPSATDVPPMEWRLWCFPGNWRVPAARYRDWANQLWTPVTAAGKRAWVSNIRTVVTFGSLDMAALDTLATRVVPSKTLLYLPNWRKDSYDVNYPDYTPNKKAKAFIDRSHKLGFRVMLHTNFTGVSPGNPDYQTVQKFQVKDPQTLALRGWYWDHPASDPQRFAVINPAASAYRQLLVDRLRPAIQALQPDAIHLDVSGAIMEDGNGPIEGMNYAQGSVALHKDLLAAFPDLVLGGETVNELLAPYEWFAQRWSARQRAGVEVGAHPISTYLLGGHVLLYGYLGQPSPEDPNFLTYFKQYERQGVVPTPGVSSVSDLDLTKPATARLFDLVSAWQTHDLSPDWDHDWNGALFQYHGSDGAIAALRDSGRLIRFTTNGQTLYQRVHDTNSIETDASIANWPAYDAKTVFGLDPSQQYWLENAGRPLNAAHISAMQAGTKAGPRTLLTKNFAFLDLAGNNPPLDFVKDLWRAVQGTTYDGADGPLLNGATALIMPLAVGGETRQVLFEHPPYQGPQRGGETFVEYPVIVPDVPGAVLKFAAGISDAAARTDPVRFRVAVNQTEVWRQDVAKGAWWPGAVDLSSYRGQAVTIRFITHPGPHLDTSFAWAAWSQISVTGDPVDGSLSLTVPGQISAATVPMTVPGSALRFLNTPRPIALSTSLLDLTFVSWLQSYGGLAAPGSIFGSGGIAPATSGGVVKAKTVNAHPPQSGETNFTWTVTLPDVASLKLAFSAGIADGANSTGLNFLIRVNGQQVWNYQTNTPGWKADTIDLSPWRGQPVLIELVSDSLGDNSYDWARWADLVITQ